jgi:WD40 repeat protein
VSFSPDGKIIASGSFDNTIKLWNLQGKKLRTFKVDSGVRSVSFSPDGKIIASGNADNTIRLWDLEGKKLLTLAGHRNRVRVVAFSPKNEMIASGSIDNTIKVWNLDGLCCMNKKEDKRYRRFRIDN